MANLTDILTNTNNRVSALETDGLDEAASVARITKMYGRIKISYKLTLRKYTYLSPSNNLYPSTNLYDDEPI